eukprot:g1317.t1
MEEEKHEQFKEEAEAMDPSMDDRPSPWAIRLRLCALITIVALMAALLPILIASFTHTLSLKPAAANATDPTLVEVIRVEVEACHVTIRGGELSNGDDQLLELYADMIVFPYSGSVLRGSGSSSEEGTAAAAAATTTSGDNNSRGNATNNNSSSSSSSPPSSTSASWTVTAKTLASSSILPHLRRCEVVLTLRSNWHEKYALEIEASGKSLTRVSDIEIEASVPRLASLSIAGDAVNVTIENLSARSASIDIDEGAVSIRRTTAVDARVRTINADVTLQTQEIASLSSLVAPHDFYVLAMGCLSFLDQAICASGGRDSLIVDGGLRALAGEAIDAASSSTTVAAAAATTTIPAALAAGSSTAGAGAAVSSSAAAPSSLANTSASAATASAGRNQSIMGNASQQGARNGTTNLGGAGTGLAPPRTTTWAEVLLYPSDAAKQEFDATNYSHQPWSPSLPAAKPGGDAGASVAGVAGGRSSGSSPAVAQSLNGGGGGGGGGGGSVGVADDNPPGDGGGGGGGEQPPRSIGLSVFTLESVAASLYVASTSAEPDQFTAPVVVIPGTTTPVWRKGTAESLGAVQTFIAREPDVDAVVIINVHGPAIENKKWLYATRLPFLQMEPAWLNVISIGVLSARLKVIEAYEAAGNWPLPSLRFRRDEAAATPAVDASSSSAVAVAASTSTAGLSSKAASSSGSSSLPSAALGTSSSANTSLVAQAATAATPANATTTAAAAPSSVSSAGPTTTTTTTSDGNETTADISINIAATIAPADMVNQEVYVMLQEALRAPLTQDQLAYKNSRGTFEYELDGMGGYEPVPVDWLENHPLLGSLILSGCFAAVLAVIVGLATYHFGMKYLMQRLERQRLEAREQAIKNQKEDEEQEDEKLLAEQCEAAMMETADPATEKKEEQKASPSPRGGRRGSVSSKQQRRRVSAEVTEDEQLELEKRRRQAEEKRRKDKDRARQKKFDERVKRLLSDEDGIAAVFADNKAAPKEVADALMEALKRDLFMDDGTGDAATELQQQGGQSLTGSLTPTPSEQALEDIRRGCCASRAKMINVASKEKHDLEQVKKAEQQLPSPFDLPWTFVRSALAHSRSSLDEYLLGPRCFLKNESEEWSTKGCTTLKRFRSLYSAYCDLRDLQELAVLKEVQTLKRHEIKVETRLMNGIIGARPASKAERRRSRQVAREKYEAFKDDVEALHEDDKIWTKHVNDANEVVCFKPTGKAGRLWMCDGCRRVRRKAYHHYWYESEHVIQTGNPNDFYSLEDMQQNFQTYYAKQRETDRELWKSQFLENKARASKFFGDAKKSVGKEADLAQRASFRHLKKALPFAKTGFQRLWNIIRRKGSSSVSILPADGGDDMAAIKRHASERFKASISGNRGLQSASEQRLWVIDLAGDEEVGIKRLCRRDAYVLTNVEVLTEKEWHEKKDREAPIAASILGRCVDRARGSCGKGAKEAAMAFAHVFVTVLACFLVPLPISAVAFTQQRQYYDTTAVGAEVVIEDLLFSPHPEHLLRRAIRVENALVLCVSLLYYVVSAVKIVFYYTHFGEEPSRVVPTDNVSHDLMFVEVEPFSRQPIKPKSDIISSKTRPSGDAGDDGSGGGGGGGIGGGGGEASGEEHMPLLETIRHIGLPVVLKATAAGGGSGIRRVDDELNASKWYDGVRADAPGAEVFALALRRRTMSMKVRRIWRTVWVSFTFFYFLVTVAYLFMVLEWVILGAVLNPTAILPMSVAVAGSVGFVALSVHKARRLRRRMYKTAADRIRGSLSTVMNQIPGQAMGKALGGHGKSSSSVTANHDGSGGNRKGSSTSGGGSGDGSGPNEKKALKIFARCDKGGSNTLTYNEYLAAYELLIMMLASHAISNMGLTPKRIAIGLISSAIGLAMLFAFIFVGIAAFGGQGNFGSSIRSAMAAAGAGGLQKQNEASGNVNDDKSSEAVDDALLVALPDAKDAPSS